jgi:Ca2+-binding EF-hand superfamily protein
MEPMKEWPAVVAIFEDIDADGDGKLKKAELRQRLADDADLLGMLADANKSVDNIFATLDINGDGMISV